MFDKNLVFEMCGIKKRAFPCEKEKLFEKFLILNFSIRQGRVHDEYSDFRIIQHEYFPFWKI